MALPMESFCCAAPRQQHRVLHTVVEQWAQVRQLLEPVQVKQRLEQMGKVRMLAHGYGVIDGRFMEQQ